MISASDGKICFAIGSHNADYACRLFSYDAATRRVMLIGKMDAALGEDERTQISQGKIHSRVFEHKPFKWDMICRTLVLDPDGFLYGSTMDGRIWKYDPNKLLRVSFVEGLDLRRVPFSQSAAETIKGVFRHNWRTIEWNPKTNSFWGLHFECSTLFEFVPSQSYIRAVAELAELPPLTPGAGDAFGGRPGYLRGASCDTLDALGTRMIRSAGECPQFSRLS